MRNVTNNDRFRFQKRRALIKNIILPLERQPGIPEAKRSLTRDAGPEPIKKLDPPAAKAFTGSGLTEPYLRAGTKKLYCRKSRL